MEWRAWSRPVGSRPSTSSPNGDTYFEDSGPLRADDSFGLAVVQVHSLDGNGELERFMTEHDARRPGIGQVRSVAARRSISWSRTGARSTAPS